MNVSVQYNTNEIIQLLDTVAGSDQNVELPLITQKLIDLLKGSGISILNIRVEMTQDLLTIGNTRHEYLKLPAELLQALKEAGIELKISIVDENGKLMYFWSFDKKSLDKADDAFTDTNLFLSVGKVRYNGVISNLFNDVEVIQNGLTLHVNQEGSFPAQTGVRIYVGNLIDIRNQTIYLYRFNSDTGKLETLPYSSNYFVDSEGYITVNLLYGSDYVILTQPADNGMITTLLDQIKVTPTKKTLYAGGTVNSETNISVVLPPTLEVVASLDDTTSGSAIGAVKVSYKSMDSNVAAVDNSGKITAVGVGTTYIITTIELYSNKSTAVHTKITVKNPYIKLTSSTKSMKAGDTFTFAVKAYGLSVKDVVWSTSDQSIITIDKKGNAKAKAKGTAYIEVKIGSVSAKIKVVVK